MQEFYLLRLMPVWAGLIMLAAYFYHSPPIKAEYILTTINLKLLAASALLVQTGALLVSHICFNNFFQLSNAKPTQVCSAQAGRQVFSTALAAPQREL
jgi:hypothetical protein